MPTSDKEEPPPPPPSSLPTGPNGRDQDVREMYNRTRRPGGGVGGGSDSYDRASSCSTSSASTTTTSIGANCDPDLASDDHRVQQEGRGPTPASGGPSSAPKAKRSRQRDSSSANRGRRGGPKKVGAKSETVEAQQHQRRRTRTTRFSPLAVADVGATAEGSESGSPSDSQTARDPYGDQDSTSLSSKLDGPAAAQDQNNNTNIENIVNSNSNSNGSSNSNSNIAGGQTKTLTHDPIDSGCRCGCNPTSSDRCPRHPAVPTGSLNESQPQGPHGQVKRVERDENCAHNPCGQLEPLDTQTTSGSKLANRVLTSFSKIELPGERVERSPSSVGRACDSESANLVEQQLDEISTRASQLGGAPEWQEQQELTSLVYRGKPHAASEQDHAMQDATTANTTITNTTITTISNNNTSATSKYKTLSGPSGAGRRRSSSSLRNGVSSLGSAMAPITSKARETFRPMTRSEYTRLGYAYHLQQSPKSSFLDELKRFLLLLLIVAICAVILWQVYEVLVEEDNFLGVVKYSPSLLGRYNHYAVSTDAEPCARVGRNLLAKGGHAVDAAIGTLLCMGVALPNSLGLGGGCLMTIYDNVTKLATVIDGRETAPDYAREDMFSAASPLSASRGPLSVGVPGELAAYWEAHQRFGRLNWSQLFDETIDMADNGFPTVEHLSFALRDLNHAQYITAPLAKLMTSNKTGEYYLEGEIMYQRELAHTLRRIRDFGVDEFYNGTTGKLFIEDLVRQGGKMTLENLSAYRPLVKEALTFELSDKLRVHTVPVPGSGVVLGIILRIMKELGYYENERPRKEPEAANLYYHHLIEAFKFAYAQRAALESDPDDPKRMADLLARITSSEFIREAAGKISDDKTHPSAYYGGLEYFQEDHGTAHASVVDNEGNSVAVTTSVNLYFGSGLVSPSTGIVYNDVMDDFTSPNITNKFQLLPSKYNRIRPGKRPLSSMAPSVFVDGHGSPRLVLGASGGSKITTAIASVALRNLFLGEDIKTAVDGPRLHHQFLPDEVRFEANFPPPIMGSLLERGHKLVQITGRSSVVMGIACEYHNSTKLITANSDYRKGGTVDGV